ncbi:hypothetical protein GGX14DRAFT_404488 [Mycena pura]|uniref:TEA domain-containing protein n=1 Tax=Mycena pura TaxID=153505 RepID=A0AAD6Y7E7_9AGAR|nr:hypothetical protein GGX14DRAFT_404488 [Mycena pura]
MADFSYYVSTVEDLGVPLPAEVNVSTYNSWLQSVTRPMQEQAELQKLGKKLAKKLARKTVKTAMKAMKAIQKEDLGVHLSAEEQLAIRKETAVQISAEEQTTMHNLTNRASFKSVHGLPVWHPTVEDALIKGLYAYEQLHGEHEHGKRGSRNKFISNFIMEETKLARTTQQISSRLQQICCDTKDEGIRRSIRRFFRLSRRPRPMLRVQSKENTETGCREEEETEENPETPDYEEETTNVGFIALLIMWYSSMYEQTTSYSSLADWNQPSAPPHFTITSYSSLAHWNQLPHSSLAHWNQPSAPPHFTITSYSSLAHWNQLPHSSLAHWNQLPAPHLVDVERIGHQIPEDYTGFNSIDLHSTSFLTKSSSAVGTPSY